MVQFNTGYGSKKSSPRLEDPIIPINELGITVPEHDPSGKFKNVVQGVQAAFRSGVGQIQLVFNMSHQSAIGGRAKSLGPEVREALREVALANEAIISGVELPTSMSNLSGYDMQRGQLSEETRREHLNEVRDAIKFTADVAQGGSVDILSWEFPRQIIEAPWNNPEKDKKWGGKFVVADEEEKGEIRFVDERTGATAAVQKKGLPPPVFETKEKEKEVIARIAKERKISEDDARKQATQKTWTWREYKEFQDILGEPIGAIKEAIFGKQVRFAQREIEVRKMEVEEYGEALDKLKRDKENDKITQEDFKRKTERIKAVIEKNESYIEEQQRTIAETEDKKENLNPLDVVAKAKSIQSYAEAGLMAMEETHNNKNIKRPIHVGPELGWPHSWGSHPQEFKELILKSREEMAKQLEGKGYTKDDAKEQAKIHIKGTLDTSHLGMWIDKFMPEEKNWEKKIKKFNEWFVEQVEDIAKADILGSVQLVDSMSGAHEHLPAGQGIFPVTETAKILKKHKFSGYFVSEGHGEEKFNEGRIFMKTWEALNASVESKYKSGYEPRKWNEINHAYSGVARSPTQMFGSYTPPRAEYRPWAGGKEPISFE
ncbi:MAG: TIM barrel protein [Nanoarchaeota archaeon]